MQAQGRALSRVPVEIWHEIFGFVTSVPRKYEFTLNGAAYVMMNEVLRAESGIPTSKEAAEITKSRFSIIRVCKYWYAIGIKALWSHLRINVYGEPIRAIEGIQEAIRRDTVLASYVIRLSLEESRLYSGCPKASDVLEPLRSLTSRLPSLQIFICPCSYALGMANPLLEVVVWRFDVYPIVLRRVLEQTTYVQNTRVLYVSFRPNNQMDFDWKPIHFPRLESLHIRTSTEQAIDVITQGWEMPNLRILSTQGLFATNWLKFIQKWSGNIEILEISFQRPEWSYSRIISIHLPNLKELRVNAGVWTTYDITAPKLERFCLLSFNAPFSPTRDYVLRAIDRARATFPALRRLQFRGDPYKEKLFHYALTSLDICNWTEAGLEVDIPHQNEGSKGQNDG